MGETFYGFILGIILGLIFGFLFFKDSYHPELCKEQLIYAETGADSLTIIQNDNFCLYYSK